jgi:ferric-dicitrate binding protein FerR (iron transport regulator)
MTDQKLKESMQIAEELAKEICTGKPSTSLLAQKWKEESPELYEEIRKQENLSQEISFHESIDTGRALEEVNSRIVLPARRFGRRTIYNIGIAASFLLVLGAATMWLWMKNSEETVAEWAASVPEPAKISLIAQNDEPVELAESNLTVQGNHLIGSTLDGKRNVAIELKPDNQFNKLSVPAGGEYRLTLEDGTTVQVNAASELLFPTHFKKHTRQVELKGEAYFKVKHNPERPFYVLLGTLNVEVTGTTFNIKAYEEEGNICVALIEGSVNVREGQKILATLSPGELFTYHKAAREYNTAQANISAITSWTEDKFVFHNETIGTIMNELSRWYNVEISVSEDIRDIRYNGILSRKQPLTEILNILHLTNELDFKIYQDRKIDAIEKKN